MLFSVIQKKTLVFSESAVSIAEALIAGTEYDLESDLQKMRN
jgi:cyanophycin synthetase